MVKVPTVINPQTRVPVRSPAYQSPYGADHRLLTSALDNFSSFLDREEKRKEEFYVKKYLADQTNRWQEEDETRRQQADLGAEGYTTRLVQDMTDEHINSFTEFQSQNFSNEALQAIELGQLQLRTRFAGGAMSFEAQQRSIKSDIDSEQYGDAQSAIAFRSPNSVDAIITESDIATRNLPGTAGENELRRLKVYDKIIDSAWRGLAHQDPQRIIDSLAGIDFTAAATSTIDIASLLRDLERFRKNAYWDDNHYRVGYGSDTATRADGSIETVTKETVVTKEDAERDLQRRIEALQAVVNRRAPNATPAMKTVLASLLYNYGEHSKLITPIIELAQAGDVEGVAKAIEGRKKDDKGINAKRRQREADLVRSGAPVSAGTPVPLSEDQLVAVAEDPILSRLSGRQLQDALSMARSSMNQARASVRSDIQIKLENAESAWLNQGTGPSITLDEIKAAGYSDLEAANLYAAHVGAQRSGKLISRFKSMSAVDINTEIERLNPTDPNSETFKVDQETYKAALRAQQNIMAGREEDPAAYIYGNHPALASKLATADTPDKRKAVYQEAEELYETLGIPEKDRVYLPKAVLEDMEEQYKISTPAQKFGIIADWVSEMGGARAGRTLGLMDDKIAGDVMMYGLVAGNKNGPALFRQMLEGQEIIDKDPARKPNYKALNEGYVTSLKNSFKDMDANFSNRLNRGVAALYVLRGGEFTVAGTIDDTDLYDKGLREIVGGDPANVNTGFVNLSGGRSGIRALTILPPGITKQQFENWLGASTNRDFVVNSTSGRSPTDRFGNSISAEDIIEYGVFVMVHPGLYIIRMAGDGKPLGDPVNGTYSIQLTPEVIRRR